MNIWQFMSGSPFLSFFLLYILLHSIGFCWNRLMRTIKVLKSGWPPPHLDADGDFQGADKEDNNIKIT